MSDQFTKTFDRKTLVELLDDAEEVDRSNWRHGHRATLVFQDGTIGDDDEITYNGEFYRITVDVHHEDGWQLPNGDIVCKRVKEATQVVKCWIPFAQESRVSEKQMAIEKAIRVFTIEADDEKANGKVEEALNALAAMKLPLDACKHLVALSNALADDTAALRLAAEAHFGGDFGKAKP